MFDKSLERFPHKHQGALLSFCSVAPLYAGAVEAEIAFLQAHRDRGLRLFDIYGDLLSKTRTAVAELLKTSTDRIAFTKNTSEGVNLLANGYPFKAGDEVLLYRHDYPANYYPWILQQQQRGIRVVELVDPPGQAAGTSWLFEELESKISAKTKVIAVSHVQFTSGYTVDLARLSTLCRQREIDLIVDAAQSVGCLPFYPEEVGVAAVCAPTWKWLMGPLGAGFLYVAPDFRDKIQCTMAGAELMKQWNHYLDKTWNPFTEARKFEYSTVSYSYLAGLECVLREQFLHYGLEAIFAEQQRLLQLAIDRLDPVKYPPALGRQPSGIFAVRPLQDAQQVVQAAFNQQVALTTRDGFLRLAPHFSTTDEEVLRTVEVLNAL